MILITGANGLVGRALVERLKTELKLQVRKKANFEKLFPYLQCSSSIEIKELDFLKVSDDEFTELTKNCSTVIHTASLVHRPNASQEEYNLLNLETTKKLAQACKKNNVKTFVFFSTIAVYGNGPFSEATESSSLDPKTAYAISKTQAENWLTKNLVCPKTIIFRPALIFGEGDRGNMLSLIKQIKKGRYFHIGQMAARKSLIYAKDVAKAVDLAINKLPDGYHVFNLANSYVPTVRELADKIAKCLNKPTPRTMPLWLIKTTARTAQIILGKSSPVTIAQVEKLITENTCSVNKLKDQIGFYEDFNLEESLRAEIAWARHFLN
jgi:nucleoside-diphosphate-sugar epimerase